MHDVGKEMPLAAPTAATSFTMPVGDVVRLRGDVCARRRPRVRCGTTSFAIAVAGIAQLQPRIGQVVEPPLSSEAPPAGAASTPASTISRRCRVRATRTAARWTRADVALVLHADHVRKRALEYHDVAREDRAHRPPRSAPAAPATCLYAGKAPVP